ncbi:unnamed protein product [Fraxinus pennsylvanica]|uniref:Uncharacterized protein n=1 Tax=Fraxinus pennsylvanica TaxID=56036 RepID=A0AAD2EBG6_9LAMI|nr:unnamed protein product [Fraxinus pennsylvanica]
MGMAKSKWVLGNGWCCRRHSQNQHFQHKLTHDFKLTHCTPKKTMPAPYSAILRNMGMAKSKWVLGNGWLHIACSGMLRRLIYGSKHIACSRMLLIILSLLKLMHSFLVLIMMVVDGQIFLC